jgi:diphthamide biosynthesis protein 3
MEYPLLSQAGRGCRTDISCAVLATTRHAVFFCVCLRLFHYPPFFLLPPGACARPHALSLQTVYDEIEIEDMQWDAALAAFTYMCPCGDLFQITRAELASGELIAHCPSCSLVIKVIYDEDDYADDAAFPPPSPPQALVPKDEA